MYKTNRHFPLHFVMNPNKPSPRKPLTNGGNGFWARVTPLVSGRAKPDLGFRSWCSKPAYPAALATQGSTSPRVGCARMTLVRCVSALFKVREAPGWSPVRPCSEVLAA